jgi:hypothetical protein
MTRRTTKPVLVLLAGESWTAVRLRQECF